MSTWRLAAARRSARPRRPTGGRQCIPPSLRFVLELRLGEKGRRLVQDLVGPFQLTVLPFQRLEPLALHLPATPQAAHRTLQFQVRARLAAGQVAHPAGLALVPARVLATAGTATCFLNCRTSVILRAFKSPEMPRIAPGAGNRRTGMRPEDAYVSLKQASENQAGFPPGIEAAPDP